jgi:uncharacterized membrane protein YidH (DUF202 family)
MTLDEILTGINTHIVNPLIVLLLAIALIVSLWGLVSYIRNLDNAEERSQGIRHMIYGVIGLVIMVSFKGIMRLIVNFLGV